MSFEDSLAAALRTADAASAIADSVDDPALLGALDTVKAARSWHDVTVDVVVREPVDGLSGVASFYVAPSGTGLIPRLAAAARSADLQMLSEIQLEMLDAYGSLEPLEPSAAIDAMTNAPALVDLRYGASLLVANMAVPPFASFGMASVAYAGVTAPKLPFTARMFPRDDETFSYETLALVTPAVLSDFEHGLVTGLTTVDDEVTLGEEPLAFLPVVVTTLLLTIAATTLHTPFIGVAADPSGLVVSNRLSRELVERLGARASVRQLVQARQELLRANDRRRRGGS